MSRKHKDANPYEGERAQGWQAFHNGTPLSGNPFRNNSNRGHSQRWEDGWLRAKMAKQQGKRAM